MSRREKLRHRLDTVEAELRARLLEELQRVASGRNTLFFATREFNSLDLPAHLLPPESAQIYELVATAGSLRRSLGLSTQGTLGHLFLEALRRANDLADEHRLGPIRLTQELLESVRGVSNDA
jgi:hypothetical protein